MPSREKPAAVDRSAWLEGARQIADFGDRWLVSLGRSVSRLGRWAEAEDRAPLPAGPRKTRKLPRRASPSSSRPRQQTSQPARPESEPSGACRPSVGLISATPAECCEHPAPCHLAARVEGTATAPGVLPLVQALGRVVADHQDGSYATLAADERLWTLVDLLQVLAQRPPPGDPPSGQP